MDPEVPLVIPEVNPEDISKHKGLIASPNLLHHPDVGGGRSDRIGRVRSVG